MGFVAKIARWHNSAIRNFTSILKHTTAPAPIISAQEYSGQTHIRSFVHRRAHITPSQEQAVSLWLKDWGLPFSQQQLNLAQVFGSSAPTVLEIGFGMGETTAHIALAQPQLNFLGIEVFNAGVGALLKRIAEQQIKNIRIIQHDAVEVLQTMLPDQCLAGVHIFFPDPWPKKKHHKRRLIQPQFVALLTRKMAPGAYLHCATDWEHYAMQMLDVLSKCPKLENTCTGFAPRPDYRPLTKFENRGLRLGHGVWDLIFKVRNDSEHPD